METLFQKEKQINEKGKTLEQFLKRFSLEYFGKNSFKIFFWYFSQSP